MTVALWIAVTIALACLVAGVALGAWVEREEHE